MTSASKSDTSDRRLRSSSHQSENIDAVRPSHIASIEPTTAVKRESAARTQPRLSRCAKVQKEKETPANVEAEGKHPTGKDRSVTLRPVQKRKRKTISQAVTTAKSSPTQEPKVSKRLCPPISTILRNVKDYKLFVASIQENNGVPAQQRFLEIHLDASNNDEYVDLHLIITLNQLHPRPDGTNPHHFETIRLVIEGEWLYTRYNYNLASPALTSAISFEHSPLDYAAHAPLERLAAFSPKQEKKQKKQCKPDPNTPLTKQEKTELSYRVNSTERLVAKALLGIRGLEEVVFAGDGAMEGVFAEVLKNTLVQLPGTEVAEPSGDVLAHSTLLLYRYGEGNIESSSYQTKRIEADSDDSELGMDDMVRVRKMEQEEGHYESGRIDFLRDAVLPLTDWQNVVEMGWEI
ncbi:hypothetical protein HBI45_023430 [Parastagonospora nodorum]|nr:hypothetical protein HBI45_023430 [Parastagonospora nodorum]